MHWPDEKDGLRMPEDQDKCVTYPLDSVDRRCMLHPTKRRRPYELRTGADRTAGGLPSDIYTLSRHRYEQSDRPDAGTLRARSPLGICLWQTYTAYEAVSRKGGRSRGGSHTAPRPIPLDVMYPYRDPVTVILRSSDGRSVPLPLTGSGHRTV